jgi:hypothetical protein
MSVQIIAKTINNLLQLQKFIVLAIITLGGILISLLQEGKFDTAGELLPFLIIFLGFYLLLRFFNWLSPILTTIIEIWIYSYRATKKAGKVMHGAVNKIEERITEGS